MCLGMPDLFPVLNISHSFAALTRVISCSTLEINLVFLRTHVLFSISTVGIKNWKNKELQKSMIATKYGKRNEKGRTGT